MPRSLSSGGLDGLERRDGGLRRRHDASRVIDHHASGGEERAADAVGDRTGAATRARDVDAVLRRGRVQLRLRRPSILGELRVVPAADAGDEGAWRDRRRARRDRLLQLGDRERSFDAACLVAGVDAGSRVVHVRIEQTGNDRASSQVDRARRRAKRPRLADADDAAVPDRQRRSHHAAAIDESSVGEEEICGGAPRCAASRRASPARALLPTYTRRIPRGRPVKRSRRENMWVLILHGNPAEAGLQSKTRPTAVAYVLLSWQA